ncbi:rhodanese-like domain-containing protein [Propionivibrio limicola]|uniref:rhodanese-like domain-containing protein n=1 Tax=Propionivibrio limicola TaxID=167645 RepID=UPI0012913E1A|nr:rhodanese-like domain-containing protein [Propionivibrio limicola]
MEFVQQNIIYIAMAVISGGLLFSSSFRRPGGRHAVSPTEATTLINRENARVVDVREAGDFAAGHLADARNIPEASLDERAGELDRFKERPVILVCQNGSRSAAACKKLEKLGFARVYSLNGGVKAWSEAGLPLKKG